MTGASRRARGRCRRLRRPYLVLLLAAAIGAAACGKRGAPLPPFVRIPAAIDTIAAARLGNDVYITLTLPDENIDESLPIDISHVDVFAYTGAAPPPLARFAELGTIVATIPVAPAPLGPDAVPVEVAPVGEPPPSGALPGTVVTIVDRLTPDDFAQGMLPADSLAPVPLPVAAEPLPRPALRRFYMAIPFSTRDRPGPPGARGELVLTQLPDPPGDVRVSYTAMEIAISWEPSGGIIGFLLDRPLPAEREPFFAVQPFAAPAAARPVVDDSVPPGPTRYNVYRELAPDPLELPPARDLPAWAAGSPEPIHAAPLATTSATDALEFGRRRCYAVRAQRGDVLSEPSVRTCIRPIDVFPPPAPAGLAAVPSEGGISLIWEPVAAPDLAGYVVLRREAGDATLRQVTETPIAEARYRDTTVHPGTRYIYTVVAVDTRLPLPNVSAESAPVEETAR